MMYWKSTETNQIYETDFIPMGKCWELSTEEEYNDSIRVYSICEYMEYLKKCGY